MTNCSAIPIGHLRFGIGNSLVIWCEMVIGHLRHPLLPFARGGDVEELAVLRDRPPLDWVAGRLQLFFQLLVRKRTVLVLVMDHVEKGLLDLLPRNLLAGLLVGRGADEESLEWEDAPRSLHPLIVHRPADGSHVHADFVGDLL